MFANLSVDNYEKCFTPPFWALYFKYIGTFNLLNLILHKRNFSWNFAVAIWLYQTFRCKWTSPLSPVGRKSKQVKLTTARWRLAVWFVHRRNHSTTTHEVIKCNTENSSSVMFKLDSQTCVPKLLISDWKQNRYFCFYQSDCVVY